MFFDSSTSTAEVFRGKHIRRSQIPMSDGLYCCYASCRKLVVSDVSGIVSQSTVGSADGAYPATKKDNREKIAFVPFSRSKHNSPESSSQSRTAHTVWK